MRYLGYIILLCLLVTISCQSKKIEPESLTVRPTLIDSLIESNPEQVLAILDSINPKETALYYLDKGRTFIRLSRPQEAEEELLKALKKVGNDSVTWVDIHYNLSRAHYLGARYKEAQEDLIQCLSFSGITENKKGKCWVMLGLVSRATADYPSALFYYKKAISKFEFLQDKSNMALCYNNLGDLYLFYEFEKNADSSIKYMMKAIEIRSSLGKKREMLISMSNLAEIYREQGKFKDALTLQEKIIRERLATEDSSGLMYSYLSLSEIYRANQQFKQAEHFALKTFKIAQLLSNYNMQRESLKGLTAQAIERKDIENAGLYFEHFDSLRLVMEELNANNIQEETERAIQTALALKQAELNKTMLEKTQAQKKLLQVQLLLLLIIASIVVFVLYRLYKRYQLWLAEKELENKLLLENLEKIKVSEKEALERLLVLGQNMVENKDVFDHVLQELNAAKKTGSINTKEIELSIKNRHDKIDDRETFIYYLQKIQEGFMQNLKAKYPSLTETEIKVCGLISLNLNSKKIATLLNVEPKSVRMYQYRIRKKLEISGDDNLSAFLNSI